MTHNKPLNSFLKIIRIPNLVIIILTQYLLRFFIIGTFFGLSNSHSAINELDFALLVLSTVFIAAGGYIINDVYDENADKKNKPKKLLIGNSISKKLAIRVYLILTISGVFAGFYIAYKVNYFLLGFVFVIIALLLWNYSRKFQKTVLWGNLIVSILSAMVIFIVWLIEFFALRANPLIYAEVMQHIGLVSLLVGGYGIFALLVSLLREMVKDAEDIEGDKEQGVTTLAVVYGNEKAKYIAVFITVITMLLLAIGQYGLYKLGYMLVFWYLLITVQLLLGFFLYQLILAKSKEDFHFLSNAAKIIMVAGVLSMQIFYISF